MRRFITLSILILSMSSVCAGNFFQSDNPFPQTSPQTLNNVYESEPATIMQEEAKSQKKSWFRKKNKNLKEQSTDQLQTCPVNEGVNDGSFYLFQ